MPENITCHVQLLMKLAFISKQVQTTVFVHVIFAINAFDNTI